LEKELKEYCTYESLNKALSFKANKEDQDELVVALEEKCSHEALEQASSLLKIEVSIHHVIISKQNCSYTPVFH
jgi:hypothetical protein